MVSRRDDFNKNIKNIAAARVGYRCSFPGCGVPTIGASMKNEKSVSNIGVAAHICAAAEGGPRYNPHMTKEERGGINNCIWLCQSHSKLIDSDELTYTVELLQEWKKEAEQNAANELANPNYWSEYYRTNGDNLEVIKSVLDSFILNGEYAYVNKLLSQYKVALSEVYQEFIIRYRIILYTYCNRNFLKIELEKYVLLPNKAGVDEIAGLFLSFGLKNELEIILPFVNSVVLKEYMQLEINGDLEKEIIASLNKHKIDDDRKIPKEADDIIRKYIANYVYRNRINTVENSYGAKYELYKDEFYYQVISYIYEISNRRFYENSNKSLFKELNFIKDNINKIIVLDILLQEYIWFIFLSELINNKDEFQNFVEICPKEVKELKTIKKVLLVNRIQNNVCNVAVKEVFDYMSETNDLNILLLYLSLIENKRAIEVLDDHAYLYKENSVFVRLRLEFDFEMTLIQSYDFINKYNDYYKDDFTFHCLKAKYSVGDEQLKEVEWLENNLEEVKIYDYDDLLELLSKYERWERLSELSYRHMSYLSLYKLANYLLASGIDANFIRCREIYNRLISSNWIQQGLLFKAGYTAEKLGDLDEAKKHYLLEYDKFGDNDSLLFFIQLRYEMKEYIMDGYFEQLKQCVDMQSQNLVGAIYLKNNCYAEARKYFLRSLLLNANIPSLNGFYSASSYLNHENPKSVNENTACVLKNDKKRIKLAIHSNDIFQGLKNESNLANYIHYSIENNRISNLLFCNVGDKVNYEGEIYKVDQIQSIDEIVNSFFFKSLYESEDVIKLSISSSEGIVEQLLPILEESNESVGRIINDYNNQSIQQPITSLAKAIGKNLLSTCELLIFNNKSIRNNLSIIPSMEKGDTYVLSYDAIIFLHYLNIDISCLNHLNLICASHVKNRLINDINEELSLIMNESHAGYVGLKDGKITMFEYDNEYRRSRHNNLNQLRNLVNSIKVDDKCGDYVSNNEQYKEEINQIFIKQKMLCESKTLAAVKQKSNRILVTDDQFLYTLANLEGLQNVGLVGLIMSGIDDWQTLVELTTKIKNINFIHYIPIQLYRKIVEEMIKENVEDISDKIRNFDFLCVSEKTSNASDNSIILLYQEIVENYYYHLNPDDILGEIATKIIKKRNPKVYESFFKRIE